MTSDIYIHSTADISRHEPLRMELEAFVRSVVNDEPFPVSGEDGLQALMLAQYLVQAGRQGRCIYMNATGADTGN